MRFKAFNKFSTLMFAAAIGLSAVAAMPVQAKNWTNVTIGLEGAYAPWNLTNPDGTIGGFEADLAKDLCARAKLTCTLVAHDWDTMIEALNANKFDVIMDALSITPERAKVIGFTVPYAATPAGFATLKDSSLAKLAGSGTTIKLTGDVAADKAEVDKFRDAFKGKTVGIQAATVYAKFVYDNIGSIATVREYKTTNERDLDLVAGRIDASFDDETALNAAFATPGNEDMVLTGPAIAGPIWGDGEGLGVRLADTDLKAKFDDAIKAAIADGTVKKLSEKWFKLDVTP
jgi:octopine/nopaline transport system substrate-binding protein